MSGGCYNSKLETNFAIGWWFWTFTILYSTCNLGIGKLTNNNKTFSNGSPMGWNALLMRPEQNDQTGSSWQEGYGTSNNYSFQLYWAEKHLRMLKTLEMAGPPQQVDIRFQSHQPTGISGYSGHRLYRVKEWKRPGMLFSQSSITVFQWSVSA